MHNCYNCNTPLSDDIRFCPYCGADTYASYENNATYNDGAAYGDNTVNYDYSYTAGYEEPAAPVATKKKSLWWLAIVIPVAILVIGGIIIFAVMQGRSTDRVADNADQPAVDMKAPEIEVKAKEIPEVTYSYLAYQPEVKVSYTYEDTIFPRQYNRMDSIAVISLMGIHGDSNVRITAEIPGFTQKFSKTRTVGRSAAEVVIKPSLITGDLGLKSAKNAQLNILVENVDTGSIILEETLTVKLMSENDINNYDPQWGRSSCDAYLAFLTPEDPVIDTICREAVPWLTQFSNGEYTAFAGYQYNSPSATYYQALAVQTAISEMGVRYVAGSYSNSDAGLALQSVKLPKEVIESKSGLCVETSLLVASVLMDEGMHCFLIFPPGHCQVAVETTSGSGEYFIIETTALPVTSDNINNIIKSYNREQMEQYITQTYDSEVYVVDCDMVDDLDFQFVNN